MPGILWRQKMWDTIYFDPTAPAAIRHRNLPHWEQEGKAYFVTFRLFDSIPAKIAKKLKQEREEWLNKNKIKDASDLHKLTIEKRTEYYHLFSKRYDELLDNGYGSCILANPECRQIIEEALSYFDKDRYYLDKYVIMPNHVHVIVIPKAEWGLSKILHSWKSFTANKINKLLGRRGRLWMDESFDHIIRSAEQFEKIREYITTQKKSNSGFQPEK
jgi:REP element-mobilizing transposase RayT